MAVLVHPAGFRFGHVGARVIIWGTLWEWRWRFPFLVRARWTEAEIAEAHRRAAEIGWVWLRDEQEDGWWYE